MVIHAVAALGVPESALYFAKPGQRIGVPEDYYEGWMASKAESQLEFEGSSSSFQALEDKVYRAIEMLKAARIEKAAAEQELAAVRELMESQSSEVEELRSQVQGLREERAQVRERVEKLLGDVDAMLDQE